MDPEDRSLDDCDGPIASFRGATLQIQAENAAEDVASLSVSISQTSQNERGWSNAVVNDGDPVSPSEIKSDVAALPWSEDHIKNLFSSREGLVDQAVQDSISAFVQPDLDGEVLGSWIMTEINIWDAEKERLVLLTNKSLLVIKFDFIALKPLEVRRTLLEQIDTLVVGDLAYPPASLVPRMNGLASGVSTIVKGCLLHWSRPSELCHTALDVSQFEPRPRNMQGLRVMWNNGEPITFSKKWNPFNNDIPYLTFASHPLLWHKESIQVEGRKVKELPFSYNVETLSESLMATMEKLGKPTKSIIQHKPILLHNYLSLGSLIHNRNSLGFFKVRGRFSF
ncbi:tumor protein p63-regulated gene 1-like protein isoform X1 [Thrips palmi]|uniref:Tumor protein p63-regulated gene 1-like protein isoform X1 n=1 Tax=Thrips palmi TaxID=161013 RepID=A0A6P8ZV33_THRPL|nr:tumor protein p63-regulated gene 1-like protein isoform X1 [Thrips palmi]